MNNLPNLPTRTPPAHPPPVDRLNAPTILFVTVCSKTRTPIYNTEATEAALRAVWLLSTRWKVGQYVIMPDHIHFFCASKQAYGGERVQDWCTFWKRIVGKANPKLVGSWLPDCWDVQMRSAEHYRIKEHYIKQNPVRAGLVESAEEWPFSGHIGKLPW